MAPQGSPSGHLSASNLFHVKGLVAVITGGGTGIGLIAAQALSVNGAKVYIVGRRKEALENAAEKYSRDIEGEIIPMPADVTSKQDLERITTEIGSREPGGIHVLMNNAGISGPKTTHEDVSSHEEVFQKQMDNESFDGWSDVFKTNVSALYFTTVAFLPLLIKGKGDNAVCSDYAPVVINTTSISGLIKKSQQHFSYNASKAAAQHLARMIGFEFHHTGVRFNSIAPGVFPSEMTDKRGSGPDQKSSIDEKFDPNKLGVPAARPGSEEDLAATVLYLCGRGGQYTNGAVINVDGGTLLVNPSVF